MSCVKRVKLGWCPVLQGLGKVVLCVAMFRVGVVSCDT